MRFTLPINTISTLYITPVLTNVCPAQVRLRVGLYSVYLRDWLRAFSRDQMHVLRLEDYTRDPTTHARQIFSFLGLSMYLSDSILLQSFIVFYTFIFYHMGRFLLSCY